MTVLTVLGYPRRASAPVVDLLSDRFDGANGTGLAAHTPDVGDAWTVHDGTPTLDGAGGLTDAETFVAAAECGATDVTIVLVAAEAAVFRVVFRLTDAANYWYAEYVVADEVLRLHEVVAGVPTLRAGVGTDQTGAARTLTVAVVGTTVSATLDGGAALNYGTMATGLAATAHGIGGDTGALIQDIVVTG